MELYCFTLLHGAHTSKSVNTPGHYVSQILYLWTNVHAANVYASASSPHIRLTECSQLTSEGICTYLCCGLRKYTSFCVQYYTTPEHYYWTLDVLKSFFSPLIPFNIWTCPSCCRKILQIRGHRILVVSTTPGLAHALRFFLARGVQPCICSSFFIKYCYNTSDTSKFKASAIR